MCIFKMLITHKSNKKIDFFSQIDLIKFKIKKKKKQIDSIQFDSIFLDWFANIFFPWILNVKSFFLKGLFFFQKISLKILYFCKYLKNYLKKIIYLIKKIPYYKGGFGRKKKIRHFIISMGFYLIKTMNYEIKKKRRMR